MTQIRKKKKGIGKTSLLLRFAEDTFNASFVPTIGVDFKFRTIELDGKKIKLQVWDTAGQERFQTITTAYYRGAMGILLVYDVTDNKTFVNIKKWTRNVERHAVENVNQILIGNKRDIVAKRVVTTEQGEALAKELGMQFVETSAKNGDNVEEAFLSLVRTIKERLTNDPIGKEEDCLDLKEEEREQGEHSCC